MNRFMDGESEFFSIIDKFVFPFLHFFSFPADNGIFIDGQTLIRYYKIIINTYYLSIPFTSRTGAQRIIKTEHMDIRLIKPDPVQLKRIGKNTD